MYSLNSLLWGSLFLPSLLVRATQWTITSYVVQASYSTVYSDEPTETYTGTSFVYLTSVSPTPTAKPYSSTTSIYTYKDAIYITYYLPMGAVPQAVLDSATASSSGFTIYDFYQDIVFTAPSSCPTQFTFSTTTLVDVPTGAEDQVTPTSTSSRDLGDGDAAITGYLTSGAVSIPPASTTSDYYYSAYIARCSNPSSAGYGYRTSRTYSNYYPTSTYRSGGGSYGYSYSDRDNCLGSLCPYWLIYIIIFCTFIPLCFLAGIFESYFWFSRFMKGRKAFRGVPLFWVCISLWMLICVRRKPRLFSNEQRQRLEDQWAETSTGKRLRLWMKYGFRHKNPPEFENIVNERPPQPYYGQQGPAPPYSPSQGGQPPMGYAPQQGQSPMGYPIPQGQPPMGYSIPQGQQPPMGYPPPQGQPQGSVTHMYYPPSLYSSQPSNMPHSPGSSPPPQQQQQQQPYSGHPPQGFFAPAQASSPHQEKTLYPQQHQHQQGQVSPMTDVPSPTFPPSTQQSTPPPPPSSQQPYTDGSEQELPAANVQHVQPK